MKYIILILLFSICLLNAAEKKSEFKCGTKKYCKEMKSCKEAMFFLNECKLSKLDKDKDGIPCEKLCGK